MSIRMMDHPLTQAISLGLMTAAQGGKVAFPCPNTPQQSLSWGLAVHLSREVFTEWTFLEARCCIEFPRTDGWLMFLVPGGHNKGLANTHVIYHGQVVDNTGIPFIPRDFGL